MAEISLCMIVKNEEKVLERCLESAKRLADEIVIVDYKTDRIFRGEELAERYRAQLVYYGKALEMMTGKKVKERLIYSFTLGKTIAV